MSERIDKIVEEIKGLSLLEASELVKKLEEVLGVSAAAAAPVMVAAAGAAPAGGQLRWKSRPNSRSSSPPWVRTR